jgi:hypothetical protein
VKKEEDQSRSIEDERTAIAQVLGVKPEEILEMRPEWEKLLRESVVVRLHIGRTRAMRRMRLSDLGLKPMGDAGDRDEMDSTVFTIGEKMLLPPDMLRRVTAAESRARRNLVKNSYSSYWGRLVVVTTYKEWKTKDLAIQKDYFGVRDDLCKDYAAVVRKMRELYTPEGEKAYDRLIKLERKTELPPKEEFVKRFVKAAVNLMPDRDEIYTSWVYETEMFHVPMPSMMAEDLAKKQKVEEEAALERQKNTAKNNLELSRLQNKEQVGRARAKKEEMVLLDAAEARKRALDEMNKDVIERARRRKETEVDQFFADLMRQIYDLTYNSTTDVLQVLKSGGGKVGPRTIVGLKRLIDQIERLNFQGNQEITEMLKPVKEQLQQDAEGRSSQEIAARLKDIAVVTRATLLTLGTEPRSARALGVADRPEEGTIRAARESLGLNPGAGGQKRKARQLELADQPQTKP